MDRETYELVMLRRPADPTEYDDEFLDDLQRRHLAFYDDLRERGIVAVNGPVIEPSDESIRGLSFFCTGSLEESKAIAEQDPSVQAGRLAVDIMTWWCQPGALRLPGQPLTIPRP